MSMTGCEPCGREFLSESASSLHAKTVHGLDGAQHYGSEYHKNAAAGKAKVRTRRAKPMNDKADLMHSCEPCSRPFAGERSLFQHATAVHGYDEATDRAGTPGYNPVNNNRVTGAPAFLLGLAPWEHAERRLVVEFDRKTGARTIKETVALYPESQVDIITEAASHQGNSTHGSSTTVSGLSCGSCTRSFYSVRALTDHAGAVHDSALEATYNEREQLVSKAIESMLNAGPSYSRVWSYVTDMTDEFVVYQVEGAEHPQQAPYSIAEDGEVTIGDSTSVRRRTVYETVGETAQ